MHNNLPTLLEARNKLEIKPMDEKQESIVEKKIDKTSLCGLWCYRPAYLQKFQTPKWALFWLCWAGALQGNYTIIISNHQ